MSKEAMKLALEALEHLQPTALTSFYTIGDRDKAMTALREALAKPDFWEGYVPEPVKPAQQLVDCHATGVCVQSGLRAEQPAQQALDKKAENARELGLDYEPVCNKDPQGCWNVRCQLGKKCKEQPAQQEPMDFDSLFHEAEEIVRQKPTWKRFIDGTPLSNDIAVWMTVFAQDVARRTSPPAQRTWVGLDQLEIDAWFLDSTALTLEAGRKIAQAIEAKLRSKNEDRN